MSENILQEKILENIDKKFDKINKVPVNEDEITICNWYCYDGKRCKKISSGDKFCKIHSILIKDFVLVDKETECSTQKYIYLIPRSRNHIEEFLKKISYNVGEIFADACVSSDKEVVEEVDITNDDFISTNDGVKFYYEGLGERGLPKAKNLKLRFVKYCTNTPVVRVDDVLYCKDCYVPISKKNGYPKIRCLD